MAKYRLLIFFFISAIILAVPIFAKAADVTIEIFNVTTPGNTGKIPANQESTLTYSIKISSTEQIVNSKCGFLGTASWLAWEIKKNGGKIGEGLAGVINANEFLVSGSVQKSGTFKINPGNDTSESFQLIAGCGSSEGVTNQLTASMPIIITVTGQQTGTVTIWFDANPKSVTPGVQLI